MYSTNLSVYTGSLFLPVKSFEQVQMQALLTGA
jgi:hypothetical protein